MKSSNPAHRTTGILLVTLALVACAAAAFEAEAPAPPVAAAPTLALTEAQAIAFAGGPPEHCFHAGPDAQLCSWTLKGNLTRPDLPPGVESGVKLLCELPTGANARPVGSCSAHVADARNLKALREALPAVSAGIDPTRSELDRGEAASRVANADTLGSLSNRVGAAPDVCRTGAGIQTCSWALTERVEGYELFAAASGRDGDLALHCDLPLDGRPRTPNSCWVADLVTTTLLD